MNSRMNRGLGGTYLSAYSIARKHGFPGTEEDWLLSLKGERGDNIEIEFDSERNMLKYKALTDIKWTDFMSLTQLQTDLEAATIEELKSAQSLLGDLEKAKDDSIEEIKEAEKEGKKFETLAKSWAVGETGVRTGENENNAKYWAGFAEQTLLNTAKSFNGRNGEIMPQEGDYTPQMLGISGMAFECWGKREILHSAYIGKKVDVKFAEPIEYKGVIYLFPDKSVSTDGTKVSHAYYSKDDGDTWIPVLLPSPILEENCWKNATNPSRNRNGFAYNYKGNYAAKLLDAGGIEFIAPGFISLDSKTYPDIDGKEKPGEYTFSTIAIQSKDYIFATTKTDIGKIYYSTNGGETWTTHTLQNVIGTEPPKKHAYLGYAFAPFSLTKEATTIPVINTSGTFQNIALQTAGILKGSIGEDGSMILVGGAHKNLICGYHPTYSMWLTFAATPETGDEIMTYPLIDEDAMQMVVAFKNTTTYEYGVYQMDLAVLSTGVGTPQWTRKAVSSSYFGYPIPRPEDICMNNMGYNIGGRWLFFFRDVEETYRAMIFFSEDKGNEWRAYRTEVGADHEITDRGVRLRTTTMYTCDGLYWRTDAGPGHVTDYKDNTMLYKIEPNGQIGVTYDEGMTGRVIPSNVKFKKGTALVQPTVKAAVSGTLFATAEEAAEGILYVYKGISGAPQGPRHDVVLGYYQGKENGGKKTLKLSMPVHLLIINSDTLKTRIYASALGSDTFTVDEDVNYMGERYHYLGKRLY